MDRRKFRQDYRILQDRNKKYPVNPVNPVKKKEEKMEIAETIKKVVQELILPELGVIKGENEKINVLLQLTNKRLDDMNAHLVDQSRRIDETNKRIDETNKRMDALRVELRDELIKTNVRMDRLYEVIVRREEHYGLEMKVIKIEQEIVGIKGELLKLAA